MRLTDEELRRLGCMLLSDSTWERGRGPAQDLACRALWELRSRRRADRNLRRLADAIEGFIERNGRPPMTTTMDLLAAVRDLVKEDARG